MIISFHLFQSLYVFVFSSLVVTVTSSHMSSNKVLNRLVIMGILVTNFRSRGRIFQYFTIYYMGILDLPFSDQGSSFLLLVTNFFLLLLFV